MLYTPATPIVVEHWYTFYRWFKTDNWAALGGIVSGIAAIISSVTVLLLWKQNSYAATQADAAEKILETLLDDREKRSDIDYQTALHVFLKTQHSLHSITNRLSHGTLDIGVPGLFYPAKWPEVTRIIYGLIPAITKQQIFDLQNYGIALSQLDSIIPPLVRQAKEVSKTLLSPMNAM